MDLKTVKLEEIIPYENNPRINSYAVDAVAESIMQCGYVAPIIVDEEMVVLAGHTRLKALKKIGAPAAECVIISDLSEEQKRKFRILDNKTNELAEWDEDLLSGELENLDLGDIHWFDDLINPNLSSDTPAVSSKSNGSSAVGEDDGIVRCPRCGAVVVEPEEDWEEE